MLNSTEGPDRVNKIVCCIRDLCLCTYNVIFFLIYQGFRYLFRVCKSVDWLRLIDLVSNIVLLLGKILSHLELGDLVDGVVFALKILNYLGVIA